MHNAKHIVLVCSRLDEPGGTERANLNAAHLLLQKGYKVTIVILDITDASFYPMDERITVIQRPYLFGIDKRGNFITRKMDLIREIFQLRKLIRSLKADVLIATGYPFAIALILAGCHKWCRVYSWEHHHYHWIKKNKFWNWLINICYPKLNGIICYNKDEPKYYLHFGCKMYVIPNFVVSFPPLSDLHEKFLLTVGWLNWRKGVDLIPYMAGKILDRHPDWKWKLIGQGELKEQLLLHINEFGLQDKLIIEDPVKPLTSDDYKQNSLFVMTSRMEPFGLVLIEAMSNGIPCIAFDCKTGPGNIITDKEDGYLIPLEDKEKMIEAIDELIKDQNKRLEMGSKAYRNSHRFSAENVFLLWRELIESVG
ncbi:MAG: glycosyltransferase family 4 protein [Flavisolibacter sp.]